MAWLDTLQALKAELDDTRRQRKEQASEAEQQRRVQRQELSQIAESLGIASLVADMNRVLLQDSGTLDSYSSWEPSQETSPSPLPMLAGDDEDDEEEADYISAELTWDEDGEREIAVDLGIGEDGVYLQVNGIDTRIEREALEQALIEAFRDELQV